MKIDRTHRPWITATVVVFAIAMIVYIAYALRAPGGPRGGSTLGLTFGIAGYALMLFAGLLGARKKVPVWRLGRAQTWLRGHLWLGLLSFPLILFHAGFAFRGPLTRVLMILLAIVWVSGILGALVQHFVPRMMIAQVPMETIYEEIPHVREQLREEADQLVTTIDEVDYDNKDVLRQVYAAKIRPFLDAPEGPGVAAGTFDSLRLLTPVAVRTVVDDLENICEEHRQLRKQERVYHWLHGWLLVHVPLSIALLVLGGVHAVMALRY
jgi:hypothetical protein